MENQLRKNPTIGDTAEISIRVDGNGKAYFGGNLLEGSPAIKALFSSVMNQLSAKFTQESIFYAVTPKKSSIASCRLPIPEEGFVRGDPWGHKWTISNEDWGGNQAICVEEGWLLYGLIRASRPKLCLETGTNRGLSALFIGMALRDNNFGHLITLDLEDWGQIDRLKEAGLNSYITCLLQNETTYTPPNGIDFIFHDSIHNYEGVMGALERFKPYMNDGCLIAVDDTRIEPSELQACSEFFNKNDSAGFQVLLPRGMFLGKYHKSSREKFSQEDIELDNLTTVKPDGFNKLSSLGNFTSVKENK